MEEIVVHGGQRLTGNVHIEGAKNAVLPILAASLLASSGQTHLSNVPVLSDVFTMNNVLKFLNTKIDFDEINKTIDIDASRQLSSEAPFQYVSKMRASIVVMGPLLARLGHAKVAMPGGCAIGSRPIDLHLKGLSALGAEGIRVIGPEHLKPTSVKTLPHPGFPTDMQPQMTILQLCAQGTSLLTETVFENRFMHLDELRRMNADFKVEGRSVIMYGPTDFNGAQVTATDLRAAAALVIAGLVSRGYTEITNLKYLDRGYFNFHGKLAKLGAEIKRVDIPDGTVYALNPDFAHEAVE